MPFLTQGSEEEQVPSGANKINWTLIGIVLVLAVIVGSEIFWHTRSQKKFLTELPEVKNSEKIETNQKETQENLIIKDFATDKKTYKSREELKVSLIILNTGEVKEATVRLTGIKPYNHAYINSSKAIDLISGENEIIFTEITPYCTSGCGGVYPGPYNLDIEMFTEESLVASSTISINLTNN